MTEMNFLIVVRFLSAVSQEKTVTMPTFDQNLAFFNEMLTVEVKRFGGRSASEAVAKIEPR